MILQNTGEEEESEEEEADEVDSSDEDTDMGFRLCDEPSGEQQNLSEVGEITEKKVVSPTAPVQRNGGKKEEAGESGMWPTPYTCCFSLLTVSNIYRHPCPSPYRTPVF
jgi:hypothetical protein